MRVVISRLIPVEGINLLKEKGYEIDYHDSEQPLTYQELISRTKYADALLSFLDDLIDENFIHSCSNLKIISNYAVGYNNVDVNAASAKQIFVTNTPGVLTEATADLTLGLILSITRNIVQAHKYVIEGKFKVWGSTLLRGMELNGKILGIVGAGRIGSAVAKRALVFGLKIYYFSRTDKPQLDDLGCKRCDIDQIIKQSDIISLHLPLSDETKFFINRERLFSMKKGAYLINTGRGKLIDEDALADALGSNHLSGAGLDVYEDEPIIHPKLISLDNVVLLPHIGSATFYARRAMSEIAATNIIDALEGRTPKYLVNSF
ncbi:MAG: 2-hydroxyacid dehydrogenase [Candidatus Kariarchaeaceae archaeon]|jgi:glyoxylate reductase